MVDDSTGPLVTAIIPSYNRPSRLERALSSIEAQTYSPIEVVVVDDHSNEPVETVLSRLDDRLVANVRCLRHEKNRGGSAARNTGLEAANGEFIAFLDDDDEWHPEKIERQVAVLENAPPNVGVVYTGVRNVDSKNRINHEKTPKYTGDVTKNLLLHNFIGTFSSVMIRHDAVKSVGLLDERFPSWQDWDYYLQLSQKYSFESVPTVLVTRHTDSSGDQISRSYRKKRDRTVPLFREKYEDWAHEYGWLFHRQMIAAIQYRLGRSALSNHAHAEGRGQLLRAVFHYPALWEAYPYLGATLFGNRGYEAARRVKRAVVRLQH